MSEQEQTPLDQLRPMTGAIRVPDAGVVDAERYEGEHICEFPGCSNEADIFVKMSTGGEAVPFLCCKPCDREKAIHAKANGHLEDDND